MPIKLLLTISKPNMNSYKNNKNHNNNITTTTTTKKPQYNWVVTHRSYSYKQVKTTKT